VEWTFHSGVRARSCALAYVVANPRYLANRSLRDKDPALICPPSIATAKSAMNVSSVSPDR
jgi:hypothetical protein